MNWVAWTAPVTMAGRALPRYWALAGGALAYFALARLGLTFAEIQESASPIWPASGFAVAALAIGGWRLFPAILLGALAANAMTGGIATAIPIAAGNTLEALAGAWLLGRFARLNDDLFPLKRTAAVTLAALAASPVSAAIGTATLAGAGQLAEISLGQVFTTWWAGDALGILLLTPLLLQAAQTRTQPLDRRRAMVGMALVVAAPLVTIPAFFGPVTDVGIFLVLPVIVAALRWGGVLAAGAALLVTAAFWVAATGAGLGPFAALTRNAAFLNMQVMLAAFAVSTLVLGEMQSLIGRIPATVFLLGCALAASVYLGMRSNQHTADERHLINIANRIQHYIEERMAIYVNALQGGASLYAASHDVERQEWRRYAQSLDLINRYPGVLGIGVVLPADKSNASAFTYAMRRDDAPDFTIRPIPGVPPAEAASTQHFVIAYIEPLQGNEAAIGLDLASEPRRRVAALMAKETGKPTITSHISLVQDHEKRPGFLLFLPIYREPASATPAETLRWYFHGWIYVPFVAEDFFANAMTVESAEVHLRIYDGPKSNPADLVFDRSGESSSAFQAQYRSQMIMLGREFTLEWQPSPLFDRLNSRLAIVLCAGGIIFCSLLSALTATLLSQKERASHYAEQMSAALARANERFEMAVDCSQDVIWDHDVARDEIWSSPRMAELYGWAPEGIGGQYWRFWRDVMEPEDFAEFSRQYQDLIAGRRDSIDAVFRCRHRDGRPLHVQTRCRAVRDDAGKVIRVIGVDTDITLVKLLEIRLRAAINVMVDGFGLFDADDRVILFNDAFIDEGTRQVIGDPTGCTFEEILRAFAYHDMPVEDGFDREAWIAQRLERHRNPPNDPIEVTWGDGRIMRISERRTPDGGYIGIWTDVTETRRLSQRLQDAISTMSDGFALFDAEDRLIVANNSFVTPMVRAHFGDQLAGHTFTELYRFYGEHDLGLSGPALEAWFEERLNLHRHPPSEPFEANMNDGRVLRVFERRTAEGGTVGTWTDITALRRAEQRLKDAIESINEGFLLLDAEGRYVVFNAQLLKLYPKTAPFVRVGGSFAEALRRGAEAGDYPHLDTPEKIDEFVQEWTQRFRDPTPFQGAAPLAGGGWVLVSHRPTFDGGCVNVYTDITALKTHESNLAEANLQLQRQAQALTVLAEELRGANIAAHQANISKSQFLANMSHELRTPLNGILGFADIIRTELFGKITPERYRDYAEDIHHSGQHLLNLINDILDLSKIEAGKMSMQIEAVATAGIADQALRLVSTLAGDRGVKLLPVDFDACPVLHADERQLRQILLNLLSNAVKFTPAGGEVSLSFRQLGDKGAEITVRDTGIGMTRAEIKLALERFGQADSSYAKSTPGTGLGLPLVEGLVKLHGGHLAIDSEKGRGTTVTVRLPWHAGFPLA